MVTGSRDWQERTIIRTELARAAASFQGDTITLVHGDARGADRIAAEIAPAIGYRVEAHPADWNRWGAAAGPIRNREMIESGVHLVLGFRVGMSRGTTDALDRAKRACIPMVLWDAPLGNYRASQRWST